MDTESELITIYKKEYELLKSENQALKRQVQLMYHNWNFDYKRFEELKAKCRGENKEKELFNIE